MLLAVPAESSMCRSVAGTAGGVYSEPSEASAGLKNAGLGSAGLCSSQSWLGPREPLAEQIVALHADLPSWFVMCCRWMEGAHVRRLVISQNS